MLHLTFTVYDSKAELYLPPFYNQTKGQAVRAFQDTTNTPEHSFHKHPEDFTLFYLGTYDDCTAKFDLEATPHSLGTALEYKDPINAN